MRGRRLAIGMVSLAALALAGCGSSSKASNASTGSGATTTTAAGGRYSSDPYGSGGAATTTSTASGGTDTAATVKVATDSKLGQFLVGPDGRTLYLFEKDQGTTTACTGGCASAWPALTVTGTPTAGAGVTAGMLSTAGGQVVYNGHLLYHYSGDKAAGEVNGTLVPSWFAVSPAGSKIG
jgi:predicted lipoprotein with Yx(FWY)xxD motif